MSLSAHLVESHYHKQALEDHQSLVPPNKPKPFTPQYVIRSPAPKFEPPPSELYSVQDHGSSRGVQSRGVTGVRRIDPVDQKPPITQGAIKVNPQNPHAFAKVSTGPPVASWEMNTSIGPQSADVFPFSLAAPPVQAAGAPSGGIMGISEYTALQISTLQNRLAKKLGPEYITRRPGPGGGVQLSYIEGWKVINLANEIFGFNGWSSQIISLTTDFCDEPSAGKFSVGVTAIIRVTLRDGTFHEDTGYGGGDNIRGKGTALDKAKKEAVTDGVKRTLKSFGNVLGNCLYDKQYLKEVQKIAVKPKPLKSEDLWRRPEFDEGFQASAQAGPSRPHPLHDQSNKAQMPSAKPTTSNGTAQGINGSRLNEGNHISNRPLSTTSNGGAAISHATKSTSVPANPPHQAKSMSRVQSFGNSTTKPVTTSDDPTFDYDEESFDDQAIYDMMDDPAVGMTGSDLVGEQVRFGESANDTLMEVSDPVVGESTNGNAQPVAQNAFGQAMQPTTAVKPTANAPTPPDQTKKPDHATGGFVNLNDPKAPESDAAARRRKAIAESMSGFGAPPVVNPTSNSPEGNGQVQGMKRHYSSNDERFGFGKPITAANPPTFSDHKRRKS